MTIDSFSGCTLWGSWDDQFQAPEPTEEEEEEYVFED